MRHLILPLALILLVGCNSKPVERKEYSCAPQNIQYDSTLNRLICIRAGAVSESPESLTIYCESGSYKHEDDAHSCIDAQKILHVVRPIILSNEQAFANKQECQKLLPQIEKRLKDEDEEMSAFNSHHISSVEKVFYSVSMNSCLYIWREVTTYSKSVDEFELFAISDALTGQRLLNVLTMRGAETYEKDRQRFEEEIRVYE